jgi:hypothetical protein
LRADPSTGRVSLPQGLGATAVEGALHARTSGEAALVGRSTGFFPIAGIRAEANSNPSALSLEKSRGSLDAPAAVQSGDGIASVTVRAFDGVSWVSGGQFRFNVETFTGVNDYTSNWRLDLRTGGALSTALFVSSALNLGVGTTTPTARLHVAGPLRHQVYTVATLPAAATVGAGTRAAVTDATTATFGAVVAGGGSVFTPVISDGTNWRVG